MEGQKLILLVFQRYCLKN